jgi:hypothetical protein
MTILTFKNKLINRIDSENIIDEFSSVEARKVI